MEEETREDADGEGAADTEQRCPICLEQYNDKTFIDPCFHCFCFQCVVQWAEVTTTCPMCKASFTTLIHNVEAIDKYSQFTVEPKTKTTSLEISISEARRFRYRTTRVPGQPPRNPSASSSSQSQSVQEDDGGRERDAAREREQRERRERRRTAAQQMSNLASDERRRVVYALGLWAQPPHTERRKERVRDISAKFFRQNPACTHRLVPWLTREFRVLLGEDHAHFMIQLVLSLVSKIELDGEEFSEHLQPFLQTKTAHFLHELVSFARSPLSMAAYDGSVRYNWLTGGNGGGGSSGERRRVRDDWDPEATVNSLSRQLEPSSTEPGRSGLSSREIQERLFHELTATRWDDSPPYLQLNSSPSSSSPIVVHGSDSENEGEGVDSPSNYDQSTNETNSAAPSFDVSTADPIEPNKNGGEGGNPSNCTQSSTVDTSLHRETTASDGLETAAGVGGGVVDVKTKNEQQTQGVIETKDVPLIEDVPLTEDRVDKEGDEEESQTVVESKNNPTTEEKDTHCTFKPGLKKAGKIGRQFRTRAISADEPGAVPTSSRSSTDNTAYSQDKQTLVEPDEECIVINAESDGEELAEPQFSGSLITTETQYMIEIVDKEKTTCVDDHEKRNYEVRQSSRKKKKKKKRERENSREKRSRSREAKKSSRTDSIKPYKSDRNSERRRRRRSRSRTPEFKSRRRSLPEERHRNFQMERYSVGDRAHRSRLYSDDYYTTRTLLHHRESSADEKRGRRRRRDREEEEKREVGEKGRKHEKRDSQVLEKELSAIDQEILQHKRQVLKAMLRSERLHLLHRQLQGRDLHDNVSELGKSPAIDKTTPTGEVEKQLDELDRAIVDQKKKVLRVMKRLEQDSSTGSNEPL